MRDQGSPHGSPHFDLFILPLIGFDFEMREQGSPHGRGLVSSWEGTPSPLILKSFQSQLQGPLRGLGSAHMRGPLP